MSAAKSNTLRRLVRRRGHMWKCQKCGLTFARYASGEPRRCPCCGDKGYKTYCGREGGDAPNSRISVKGAD
jgi:rubrerythrin